MAGDNDWLHSEETDEGTKFRIRQRRNAAASMLRNFLLVWGGLLLATGLALWALDTHPMGFVPGILLILLVIFGSGICIGLVILALLQRTKHKAETQFLVTNDSVLLLEKHKASYPTKISRADISEFFLLPPNGRKTTWMTTTVVVARGGVGGQLANLQANTQQLAQALGQSIAEKNYSVGLNWRGSDVVLAGLLSESESEYLFEMLKRALSR
jgi:hypothetical protein